MNPRFFKEYVNQDAMREACLALMMAELNSLFGQIPRKW